MQWGQKGAVLAHKKFSASTSQSGGHPHSAFQGPEPWHCWLQWQNLMSHHRHCGTQVPGLVFPRHAEPGGITTICRPEHAEAQGNLGPAGACG